MASTGEVWRLGRRPALDGLRGVAVLLVIASHMWPSISGAGAAGVSIFFTLSGFLITALLLEEGCDRGRIGLRRFYARRARRLLPGLAALLVVALAAGQLLSSAYATPAQAIRALLYVANWAPAAGGSGGGLGHTWSLSVEEQFYLTYPLLVATLAARGRVKWLVGLTGVGIVASVAARFLLWNPHQWGRVYYGTDTNAAALLIGAALALSLRYRPRTLRWPTTTTLALIAVASSTCGITAARLWMPLLVPVGTCLVIWCLVTTGGARWLAAAALAWCGRRSYGLYLWHFPLVGVTVWETQPPTWVRYVLLAATFLAAWLSWRYVEEPWQRSASQRQAQHSEVRKPGRLQRLGAA